MSEELVSAINRLCSILERSYPDPNFKVCKVCRVSKPLEDFHLEKRVKDGRKSKCKKCYNDEAWIKKQWAKGE